MILSKTQCSCLQFGLSTYISTLRELNQSRKAAATTLSSLAMDSISSQREALFKQGQARELLGQMSKHLEEEQLAMARLHMTPFTQVWVHGLGLGEGFHCCLVVNSQLFMVLTSQGRCYVQMGPLTMQIC